MLSHATSTVEIEKYCGQYQIMKDVEGQISTTTPTLEPLENNLTATNLLLLKQTTIEEELLKRQQQIDELRIQVEKLKQLEPENLMELKQNNQKLRLEQQKYLHQHLREIEDEQIWLSENRHLFQTHSDLIFNNKQQTLMNIKLLEQHLNNECIRISQDYPSRANEFQQQHLYQYYYDSSDAEAWLGEQELYMMSEEHGKDELTTQASIRKQQAIDQTIEDYSHVLHELNDRAKIY
ncbi:unnamed protein product [Rotaria sordida]|uniref:Uncharacterized protein n=1 Tax=Rotaria sordida TaxID=392033 RepID=A0A815IVH0_9BILA|nr:unnamed protein product [Rotaria sordida]